MRTSLREQLNSYIRINGKVSYNTIKDLVETGFFGKVYKISNAERRLRQSESPDVEAEYENGHIKSYVWKGRPVEYKTYKILLPDGSVDKIIQVSK
jgi:hypothetical protein